MLVCRIVKIGFGIAGPEAPLPHTLDDAALSFDIGLSEVDLRLEDFHPGGEQSARHGVSQIGSGCAGV